MRRGERGGIVLVVVLAAMLLIAAVIGGALYCAETEIVASDAESFRARAAVAAEVGLRRTLTGGASPIVPLVIGGTSRSVQTYDGFVVTTTLTRPALGTYWLVSDAVGGTAARRVRVRLGVNVTLDTTMVRGSVALAPVSGSWAAVF